MPQKNTGKVGAAVKDSLFFFNSNPYLIEAERLKEVLDLYDNPTQVVIEVTERAEIKDFPSFCQTIRAIKEKGFRISIDDVGSGYASLDAVAELEPDFVKIDIAIVRGLHENPKKQNLVKAIMHLCKPNKVVSIGEGIEVEEELRVLRELGVEAGQGYFLGRPNSELVQKS